MAVIRISGDTSSGKTILADRLAPFLRYSNVYTGEIFRNLADQRGVSLEQFYAALKTDPELEKAIDRQQEDLMLTRDNMVIQGRMAPFLGCGFKAINILLMVNADEGCRREMQRPKNAGKTMEEMRILRAGRLTEERNRYSALYGIPDHLDGKYFDVVIDTTQLTPDEVFEKVLDALIPHLLN